MLHAWQPTSRSRIQLNQKFTSSLLKLGQDNRQWKDNQSINIKFTYALMSGLYLKSNLSSLFFSDQQTSFANDLNVLTANVGGEYLRKLKTPNSYFQLAPFLGIKSDRRYDFTDKGMTYAMDFNLNEFEYEESQNSLRFSFQQEMLGVRRNHNTYFNYQIQKEFQEETADTLSILIDQKSRDYYVSDVGEIERLNEASTILRNKLKYHISDNLNFHLLNELRNRQVEASQFTLDSTETRDTRKHTDFKFDNRAWFRFESERIKGLFNISYWSQEQIFESPSLVKALPTSRRLAFVAPDNQSHFFALGSSFGWQIFNSDSLAIGTTISRLKYDTPDTSNFDDRDEVRFDVNLREVHIFNSALRIYLDAIVSLYHLAYIYGERSADNTWNRIFRLSPGIRYQMFDNLRLIQDFEVLANYVDYDFEVDANEIRSFIYRKFASETNLNWQISAQNMISLSYQLEFEENGKLYWDRWSERPLLSRKNTRFRMNYSFFPKPRFLISPGINIYTRDEWNFYFNQDNQLKTKKKSDFLTMGPILNIIYNPHPKYRLSCTMMRNAISGNQAKRYYINQIDINLNYNF